jgi:hypothetical protein
MRTFKKQFVCIDMRKAIEGIQEVPSDIKLEIVEGNDTFVKLEYDAHEGNIGIPELCMDGHDVNTDNPKLLDELLCKLGIDDDGTEKECAGVML